MKLSSREKTYLNLVILVFVIWGLLEVWEIFTETKIKMKSEIASKNASITEFMTRLEGQDPDTYLAQAADLEEQLARVREKVLELPKEEDASLVVRSAISDKAEITGMNINSINVRKSKTLNEERQLKEILTYFGYDSDLESLLRFFATFEDAPYYVAIDTLTISARRQPRVDVNRRNKSRNIPDRKPLNGNGTIRTLYMPNENGKIETYEFQTSANLRKHEDSEHPQDKEKSDKPAATKVANPPVRTGGLKAVDPSDYLEEDEEYVDEPKEDTEVEAPITPIPREQPAPRKVVGGGGRKNPIMPGRSNAPKTQSKEDKRAIPGFIGQDSENSQAEQKDTAKPEPRKPPVLEEKPKPLSGTTPRKQQP